jgi:hypothetical protein
MKSLKLKNHKLSKQLNGQYNGSYLSLRIKILILFLVIFMVVSIYDTYFEDSTNSNSDEDTNNDAYPKLKESSSIIIYKGGDNQTSYIKNPTISIGDNGHYLIPCEEYNQIDNNNRSGISLITSPDGKKWSRPHSLEIFNHNLVNPKSPQLTYVNNEYYVLSIAIHQDRYFSISQDGKSWSPPERSELHYYNDSIIYEEDYMIIANNTGLWSFNYNVDMDSKKPFGQGINLLSYGLRNASIEKINNYKYLIVHENISNNNTSIVLTTIFLKHPNKEETALKWDLLLIFVVLGLILLLMIIREVSRD